VQLVRRTFAPALISRGVLQISAYIDMGLATLLPHGLVAIQLYASTIYMLPVSLFGMSIAASELPELSDAAGESADAAERVRARLALALERVAFFIVPSAVALVSLGDVIIGILLRGGRFGHTETMITWAMLAGSAIGLLAATMGRLYSSTFFAFHDTTTPQRFAIVRVVVGAALGAFLGLLAPRLVGIERVWGGAGLSLGGAIAGWIEFTLLRRHMDRRVGRTGVPKGRLPRLALAAVGAAIVAIAARLYLPDLGRHVGGAIILLVFSLFYGAAAFALGIPQAESVLAKAARVVRRR
jgi:putative peptidoglycan lipid II flippase